MKRFTLGLFLVACFALQQASAQNFDGKNMDLGVGIGLGSSFTYGNSAIPPIFAQLDFGVADKISVGATAGFTTSSYGYATYDWRYTYIVLGARGNYHWGKHISSLPEKLDLYAGLTLGYYIVNVDYDGFGGGFDDGVGNSVWLGGQVGGRWFFKENMAAFAELGAGIAYFKIGINFRLK